MGCNQASIESKHASLTIPINLDRDLESKGLISRVYK